MMVFTYIRRLATIGLLLVAIGLIINGIMGTLTAIATARDSINETSEKLARLESKEASLKNIGHANLAQEAQKLTDAIPQTINLPIIVATLTKIAGDTNVELGDFSISSRSQALTILSVQNAEKLTSFQFRVNLTGNLENTKRFINELGKVSPMLGLEGLEVSTEKSKLILNFYFQPQLISKTKLDEFLEPLTDTHRKAISEVLVLSSPGLEEISNASASGTTDRQNPFR